MVKILQIFQKMLGLYGEVLVVGGMKAYSRSLSTRCQAISIFLRNSPPPSGRQIPVFPENARTVRGSPSGRGMKA